MKTVDFPQTKQGARRTASLVPLAIFIGNAALFLAVATLFSLLREPSEPWLSTFTPALGPPVGGMIGGLIGLAFAHMFATMSSLTISETEVRHKRRRQADIMRIIDILECSVLIDRHNVVKSITLKDAARKRIDIEHREDMLGILDVLKKRMPTGTVIESVSIPTYRQILPILVPISITAIIIAYQTMWRSSPAILVCFPAFLLPFALWVLAGNYPIHTLRLSLLKNGRRLRSVEIGFGLFLLCAGLFFSWAFSHQFDENNSCSLFARSDSGCIRFVSEATQPFRFGEDANTVYYGMKYGVLERQFGRFQRSTTSLLFPRDDDRHNDEFAISEDAQRIVTYDWDTIEVWDRDQTRPIWTHDSHPADTRLLSNDKTLIALSDSVVVINLAGEERVRGLSVRNLDSPARLMEIADAKPVAFTQDNMLVSLNWDTRQLMTHNPQTGAVVRTVTLPATVARGRIVARSADGALFTIINDDILTVYAIKDGQAVATLPLDAPNDDIYQMNGVFSAENKKLFLTQILDDRDDTVLLNIFDLETGQRLASQTVIADGYLRLYNVDVSADGSTLGVATSKGLFLYSIDQLLALQQ